MLVYALLCTGMWNWPALPMAKWTISGGTCHSPNAQMTKVQSCVRRGQLNQYCSCASLVPATAVSPTCFAGPMEGGFCAASYVRFA